jgi:translation elongation factor EF-1alpha
VAALESAPPYELTRFKARVFWLGKQPFKKGQKYKLKLATQEVECEIESIEKVIDASTLATVSRHQNELFVGRHEVGELTLKTKRPIAFDAINEIVPTGPFRDRGRFRCFGWRHYRCGQLPAPDARSPSQERQHLLEPRQSDRRPAGPT